MMPCVVKQVCGVRWEWGAKRRNGAVLYPESGAGIGRPNVFMPVTLQGTRATKRNLLSGMTPLEWNEEQAGRLFRPAVGSGPSHRNNTWRSGSESLIHFIIDHKKLVRNRASRRRMATENAHTE